MKTQEISAAELLGIIEKKDRRITELEQQNEWLMEQFRLLRHNQFGATSEQSNPDQMDFFNEAEAFSNLEVPESELTEIKAHHRKKTRLTTDRLPDDIPVEIIEHTLPENERVCSECGGALHTMGRETREELKIIPAKAVIVRHVRHVYSCRACENTSDHVKVIKADMPEPVIKGGFASPESVAHIAVQKFMMASPLYRQEKEWELSGILLSRQTMSNWLIKTSEELLCPIYQELKRILCEHEVLHADESTLQVLKEPEKPAQSKSYMWLYRTSGEAEHPIVLYEYQPDRKRIHPEEFLENFSGYIHTDGYDGYHNLPERITVVGCWAHLRRKLFDALKTLPKDSRPASNAAKGVAYCDKLFHLEKQFASMTSENRKNERELISRPLMDEFFCWIDSLGVLPGTLLGKAVHYAKSQRKYLERYLLDGRLEISNNRAERSIKPFVIGRKNWLFSNTPNGAKASAIYYSLIVTAKENGLNPFEYLSWILMNMPNLGKPGYAFSIKDLLPGSSTLPQKVFSPMSKDGKNEKYAWEEHE